MTEHSTVATVGSLLGEGPLWDPGRGHVLWVDIERRLVHDVDIDTGRVRSIEVDEGVTALGLTTEHDTYIASLRRDVALVDTDMRVHHRFGNPEPDRTGNRFNDGKVGPDGAWWTGTMHDGGGVPTGALHRLDPTGHWQRVDDGIAITNGPCFSPDGAWLYHNDTENQVVHRFPLGDHGALGPREVFASIEGAAHPDGMTTDRDGTLYVCLWGGWGIARFRPDGTELDRIELPVAQVTSCTFGGHDLTTLLVTSAATGLSATDQRTQPQAGNLLAVRPGRAATTPVASATAAVGLPSHRFRLS